MNKEKFILLIVLLLFTCFGYSQRVKDFSVYKTEKDIIYDICFTDKGVVLGIADNNTIKVYSTNSKELITEFKNGHKNQIQAIDISKDSTLLVSGGKDSTIVVWDFINNKILRMLTFQQSIITSIKISPYNKYLVSGGIDKLCLYDIELDKVIRELVNHSDVVTSIAFTPDEKIFASSSADKSINIYETKSGNLLAKLTAHKSWVRSITFSKDGTKLISCGDDARIIIWNISDLNNIKILTNSKHGFNWLLSVDFNQDNKTYAFGDFKGNAEIVGQFGSYKMNIKSPINKILFIPNEGIYLKIIIATRGKGVLFIDAKNMKLKHN